MRILLVSLVLGCGLATSVGHVREDFSAACAAEDPKTVKQDTSLLSSPLGSFLDSLRVSEPGVIEIYVHRNEPFTAAVPVLLSSSGADIRKGFKSVNFVGEDGHGSGVIRDWFSTASEQISSPDEGLFEPVADQPHYLVFTSTGTMNRIKESQLKALGKFMGLALVTRQTISLNLPVMFYAASGKRNRVRGHQD
jgi:hypothetical protein